MSQIKFVAMLLVSLIFSSKAFAQSTYYDYPYYNPPGVTGYGTSFTGVSGSLPDFPSALANVLWPYQHGTCGGDCEIKSITWNGSSWTVKVGRPGQDFDYYPVIFMWMASGVPPYTTEPPGVWPATLTAYPYNPRKSLGPSCPSCGNPINIATGNKFQVEVDLPATGLLGFTRYYNSYRYAPTHLLGLLWTHTYTRKIDYQTSKATVTRPGGKQLDFVLNAGQWVPDADVTAKLQRVNDAGGVLVGWTYIEDDDREIETYDATGRLMSIQRLDGNSVTLTYSGGLLTTAMSQDGRAIAFTYDASQRIATVTAPSGLVVSYQYDSSSRLAGVQYAGATGKQYLYNEPSFTGGASLPTALTGIIDENNARFATFTYAPDGRAIATEHAGGVERFALQFNGDGTTTVTTPWATTQTYGFAVKEGVHRTTVTSETAGGVTRATASTVDSNGRPDIVTDPSGTTTDYDYNSRGLTVQVVESANKPATKRTTQFDWHPIYRLPTEQRVYGPTGSLVETTTFVYNAFGQIVYVVRTDPVTSNYRVTSHAYCDVPIGSLPPEGCPYSGPISRTTEPEGSPVTRYYYYQESSCTAGSCSRRVGDLWKVVRSYSLVTEVLSYNDAGQPKSIKDANGVVTGFEYTSRGWPSDKKVRGIDDASETDDTIRHIDHWPTGDIKKLVQPDGAYTTFTYDAAHRCDG